MTRIVVPLRAKYESYNSSNYDELTYFNVSNWLYEYSREIQEQDEEDN